MSWQKLLDDRQVKVEPPNKKELDGAFRSFLSLAAEHSGEEVRYERLASRTGVTGVTVRSHYEILLDTLLAFELRPINLVTSLRGRSPRRESKTAKIYLFDTGIVNAIRGRWKLSPAEHGKALEHLVLVDLLAVAPRAPIGFWRQHQAHEVDFVLLGDDGLTGIEVKATRQPGKRDLRGLHQLHKIHGLSKAILVCDIDNPIDLRRHWQSLDATLEPPATLLAVPIDDPFAGWLTP